MGFCRFYSKANSGILRVLLKIYKDENPVIWNVVTKKKWKLCLISSKLSQVFLCRINQALWEILTKIIFSVYNEKRITNEENNEKIVSKDTITSKFQDDEEMESKDSTEQ